MEEARGQTAAVESRELLDVELQQDKREQSPVQQQQQQQQQQQLHFGHAATRRPAARRPLQTWHCQLPSRGYRTTSHLHSYYLSPPQVNSILKANEYNFKVWMLVDTHKKTLDYSM